MISSPVSVYLLFCYADYYPAGGWNDFRGAFLSAEEAYMEADRIANNWTECGLDQQIVYPDGRVIMRNMDYNGSSLADMNEWVDGIISDNGLYYDRDTAS